MATKKQKRAAALARREAFLAEERELGRKAIEAAARRREVENRKTWEEGHAKHYKFVDECPHCSDAKKKIANENRIKSSKQMMQMAEDLLASKTENRESVDA